MAIEGLVTWIAVLGLPIWLVAEEVTYRARVLTRPEGQSRQAARIASAQPGGLTPVRG